jgi:hypothetical protein
MASDVEVMEVTSKGDSFGFSLSEPKVLTADTAHEATRYFIINTKGGVRAPNDVYLLLPKKGDVHPEIADCYVSDVTCKVTDDVHIYQATVNYKWVNPAPTDPNYPWLQPAAISFSTDTSITRAMDMSYLQFGVPPASPGAAGSPGTLIEDCTPAKLINMTVFAGDGINATIPIVNEPLREQPMNLPEEPVTSIAITISCAIEGGGGLNKTAHHDISQAGLLTLLACSQTVYGDVVAVGRLPMAIQGYTINQFCGYITDIKCEAMWYKSEIMDDTFAYYKVDITLLDNPETWIRKLINLSYNCIVDGKVTAMTVTDGKNTIRSKISKPMRINPTGGAALDLDMATGILYNTTSGQTPGPTYTLLHLTKRLSDWAALKAFLITRNVDVI